MNKLLSLTLQACNEITGFKLTPLQRIQCLSTLGFAGSILFVPHRVWAQAAGPLTNGAGTNGGSCANNPIGFMAPLITAIGQSFAAFGGIGDSICQIITACILMSLAAAIIMILWAVIDSHHNEVPFKKSISPFLGWLTAIAIIYALIALVLAGNAVNGNAGNNGVI